jgi:hypothetical protein
MHIGGLEHELGLSKGGGLKVSCERAERREDAELEHDAAVHGSILQGCCRCGIAGGGMRGALIERPDLW